MLCHYTTFPLSNSPLRHSGQVPTSPHTKIPTPTFLFLPQLNCYSHCYYLLFDSWFSFSFSWFSQWWWSTCIHFSGSFIFSIPFLRSLVFPFTHGHAYLSNLTNPIIPRNPAPFTHACCLPILLLTRLTFGAFLFIYLCRKGQIEW